MFTRLMQKYNGTEKNHWIYQQQQHNGSFTKLNFSYKMIKIINNQKPG